MEYAVIEIGGKQYRVFAGDVIEVDRLGQEAGPIIFDRILLSVTGEEVKIGKPYIDGVSVSAKLLENLKGKKIRVARFTAKSRHRRVVGFRPYLSRVQIEKISNTKAASAPKSTASVKAAPAKK